MPKPLLRRLATPDDLQAVYDIYMHPEVVPYLGIDPVSIEGFKAYYAGLLSNGAFFVVPRDGAVRGLYRVNRQPNRSSHVVILTTLAIAPSEKGTGLAAAMFDEAIDLMRAEGVLRVELTLEADNKRALSFYLKRGFEQEGRLRKAYKRAGEPNYLDELVMSRWLGSGAGERIPGEAVQSES